MKPTYEELEQERNELAAQVERLRAEFPLFDDAGLCEIEHHCEWALQQDRKRLHLLLSETPPGSLAALKARWQAEAVESILNLDYGYIQFEDGSFAYTEDAISGHAEELRQHLQEKF